MGSNPITSTQSTTARTEGLFAETAGGVTVASLAQMAERGTLDRESPTVAIISGHGLKTLDAVVDTATRKVTKYLLVGQRVWHMAFTPDEKYLLTTNGVSNDVSVIDVAAQKVIKTIQVGELPWGITIAP